MAEGAAAEAHGEKDEALQTLVDGLRATSCGRQASLSGQYPIS
jgi:hypothetical protein